MVLKCNKCGEIIDKELVPLIHALNDAGLLTRACCRGHTNRDIAYIVFHPNAIRGVDIGQVAEDTPDGVIIRWNFKYQRDTPIYCMYCRGGIFVEVDEDAKDTN